jgi:hypothetical protein
MLSLNILSLVETGVVSGYGDDSHTAASVCATTSKDIIRVFVEIVLRQQKQGKRVFWQNADRCVKQIIQVKLAYEYTISRWPGPDPDAFGRGIEANESW